MKKLLSILSTVLVFVLMIYTVPKIKAENVQLIYTEEDLANIGLSGSYKLMNDISLTSPWEPLGNVSNPFSGTIDGNGHSIKNFSIAVYGANKGFISYASNASIMNLTIYASIDNSYGEYKINALSSSGSSYASTGIFVGECKSCTFTDCASYGTIRGSKQVGGICGTSYNSTFTSVKNHAKVLGVESVGGIVGLCSGTVIDKCANTGKIYGETNVGGIIGLATPKTINGALAAAVSVTRSYNSEQINCSSIREGGIVGYVNNSISGCSFSISDCYNTGIINSENENISSAGIIGAVSKKYGTVTVSRCYNAGFIVQLQNAYGICTSDLATLENCYALNNGSYKKLSPSSTVTLTATSKFSTQSAFNGFDFDKVWEITPEANYTYPDLKDNKIEFTSVAVYSKIISMPYIKYIYLGADSTVNLLGFSAKVYMSDGTVSYVSNTTDGLVIPKYSLHLGINIIPLSYKGCEINVPFIVVNDFTEKNILTGMGDFYPVYSCEDLTCISKLPNENFLLMNDIDCSAKDFKGICSYDVPFSGSFIGNGKTVTLDSSASSLFICTDNAKVSGVNISGTVNGKDFAASLIGEAKNTQINDCHSNASVSCSSSGDVSFLGGLVGYSELSTTQQTTVSNCSFSGNLIASATANYNYVGGIIGEATLLDNTSSAFENNTFSGKITFSNHGNVCIGGIIGCVYARSGVSETEITSCVSYGTVIGRNYDSKLYIGGIAGDYVQYSASSKFSVNNCMNIIRNSSINSAKSIYVGGIISQLSYANAKVENCYVLGAYTTSSSSQPYAITTQTNFAGKVNNCYVLPGGNKTFGNDKVLTKSQSVLSSSYTGFDFANVWTITGEYVHPQLKSAPIDENILEKFSEEVYLCGTPNIGDTLFADKTGYLYRWYADGVEIPGATEYTYTLTENDLGKKISVRMYNCGLFKGYSESSSMLAEIYRIESDAYDLSDSDISKIPVGTTVNVLTSWLNYLPADYKVKDGETVLGSSDIIKTGCTLTVNYVDKTVNYDLYVLGDIDKDGMLTKNDAQMIRDYLLGKTDIPEIKCADVNLDGYVDARDSIIIKQKGTK